MKKRKLFTTILFAIWRCTVRLFDLDFFQTSLLGDDDLEEIGMLMAKSSPEKNQRQEILADFN